MIYHFALITKGSNVTMAFAKGSKGINRKANEKFVVSNNMTYTFIISNVYFVCTRGKPIIVNQLSLNEPKVPRCYLVDKIVSGLFENHLLGLSLFCIVLSIRRNDLKTVIKM